MPRTYVSLIQADYGRSRHGNFEAVLVQGEQLWHWFRDGRYRSSDVYLAVKPVARLEEPSGFCFTSAASANLDGVLARTVQFHSSVLAVSANCRFAGIRCWAPGYASTTRIGRQIDRPLAE